MAKGLVQAAVTEPQELEMVPLPEVVMAPEVLATVVVATVVAMAPPAMAVNDHKIYSKCGFLATFFWLTNNSRFAIILV
jgi:hypothetical protein